MKLSDYDGPRFEAWLTERGAERASSHARGELLRFFTHEGVGTVYVNSRGKITLSGVAGAAYQAFRNQGTWKALPRPRDSRQERFQQWNELSARDGPWCIYCDQWLNFESFTLEHFLAKTYGGTNYYANLGLACEPCNRELGNLPVAQKIQIALKRRLRHEDLTQAAGRNGPSVQPGGSSFGQSSGGHAAGFGPYPRRGPVPRDEGGH